MTWDRTMLCAMVSSASARSLVSRVGRSPSSGSAASSSPLILVAVLLGATALGVFLGHRVRHLSDSLKEPFGILQGALLGLVGLLLAFGLSLAVSRYEVRRANVVTEANAIGTTYLRAQTLPEPVRSRSLDLLDALHTRRRSACPTTCPAAPQRSGRGRRAAPRAAAVGPRGSSARRGADGQRAAPLRRNAQRDVRRRDRARRRPGQSRPDRRPAARGARRRRRPRAARGLSGVVGRGVLAVVLASALVAFLLLVTADLDRPTRGMIQRPRHRADDQLAVMTQPPAATRPGRQRPEAAGGAKRGSQVAATAPASLARMNSERSEANTPVMKTLNDEGPAKLFPAEMQVIRTAADALLFDGDAYDELAAVEDLAQQLVDADRWLPDHVLPPRRRRRRLRPVRRRSLRTQRCDAPRAPRRARRASARRACETRCRGATRRPCASTPRLRDLPVRQPFDRERHDATLARAQRVRSAARSTLHARAGDLELRPRRAPAAVARHTSERVRPPRRGRGPRRVLAGAAQDRPELEQGTAVLEPGLGLERDRHRLGEHRRSARRYRDPALRARPRAAPRRSRAEHRTAARARAPRRPARSPPRRARAPPAHAPTPSASRRSSPGLRHPRRRRRASRRNARARRTRAARASAKRPSAACHGASIGRAGMRRDVQASRARCRGLELARDRRAGSRASRYAAARKLAPAVALGVDRLLGIGDRLVEPALRPA